MIANSPVPQHSPSNSYGMDVASYQPPWQALSDFAANAYNNSEYLDPMHPNFQRLAHQMHGYDVSPLSSTPSDNFGGERFGLQVENLDPGTLMKSDDSDV